MAACHREARSSSAKRFAGLGVLLALFALSSWTPVVQPGFAVSAPAVESDAKVSIANFAFTPGDITITPGVSVTWTNDDGAPHGLHYHDGEKGTDLLLPGANFSRRFDSPGTYDYNCSVHPYMTGRVVVRAP